MINVLSWIFVFGLIILVHELGHFMVAKWTGVKVLEFSFGFGPKLFGYQGKETLYALRLFPLGGYVRMHGMDAETDETGKPVIVSSGDPRSFMNKTVGQRIAIIASGAIMNFLLALVLFVIVFAYLGIPEPSESNAIGTLIADKPAMQTDLREGDQIVSINGIETPTWSKLTEMIHARPDQELNLAVVRDAQEMNIQIMTETDPQTGNGMIGISPVIAYQKTSILESMKYGVIRTFEFTRYIVVTLAQMVSGQIQADVGGPVMIAQAVGEAVKLGFINLLAFTGIISIQLGLLNLFPIPALDGSRIVFLLIEGLRGKPLNPERENLIHLIGFSLLILFSIVITYKDILRLLGKS